MATPLAKMGGSAQRQRIAQLVAAHNTAAIPDRLLPANLKAGRAAAQAAKARDVPYVQGGSLTPNSLAADERVAAQDRFGPKEQDLRSQLAGVGARQQETQGWYGEWLQAIKDATAAQEAGASRAGTQVQGLADSGSAADTRMANDLASQMQQSAASRGATVDPMLQAQLQGASATRRALLGSAGAEILARGANAGANLAGREATAAQQGVEAHGRVNAQRDAIANALSSLANDKGLFAGQYKEKAVAGEQKAVATQTALDSLTNQRRASVLKAGGINPVTGKPIPAKPPSAGAQKTAADLAFFKAHGYYPPTGPPKTPKAVSPATGPGSLKPAAEEKIVSEIRTIVGAIKSSPKVDDQGKPLDDHAIRNHLLSGKNPLKKAIDPALVNIAFDIARLGGLSPANVKALHGLGVHLGGHFNRAPTAPAYQPPTQRAG